MNTQPQKLTYQDKRAVYLGRNPQNSALIDIVAAGHLRTVAPSEVTISLTAPPEPAQPSITFDTAVDIWLDGNASGIRSILGQQGCPDPTANAIACRIAQAITNDPIAMDGVRQAVQQRIDDDYAPLPELTVSLDNWAGATGE